MEWSNLKKVEFMMKSGIIKKEINSMFGSGIRLVSRRSIMDGWAAILP